MAIKIQGNTVINDSRGLTNIASIDETTAAAILAAGVGTGGGGNFNTAIVNAVGYDVDDTMSAAFTAPSTADKRYVIHSIHITNISAEDLDISGQMYSNTSFAYTLPVPIGSSVELLKKPKVLSPNETIELQASANTGLSATISYEIVDGTDHFGEGIDITGTDTYQDLHVATANSVVESILLSNDNGFFDVKATVVWTDGSNNIQGYYVYEMIIPNDSTVEILEAPKALPSGYKVRVKTNQPDRLEAIIAGKVSS